MVNINLKKNRLLILSTLAAIFSLFVALNLVKVPQKPQRAVVQGGPGTLSFNPQTARKYVGEAFPVYVEFQTGGIPISSISFRATYPYSGSVPELDVVNTNGDAIGAIYPNNDLNNDPDPAKAGKWSFSVNSVTRSSGVVTIDFAAINQDVTGFSTITNKLLATVYFKVNRTTQTPVTVSFDPVESKMMTKADPPQDILAQPLPGSYTLTSATGTIVLNPKSATKAVNEVFPVDINFQTGGEVISSLSFRITYPYTGTNKELEVVDANGNRVNKIYVTSSLSDWSFPVNSVTYGSTQATIDFSALNTSTSGYSSTQNVPIATMYLKSTKATSGPILLTFDQEQSKMMTKADPPQDILTDPQPGSYTFTQYLPSPTPTPRLTATPTPTPRPTNTPTPTPSPTATPTSSPTPIACDVTFNFGFRLQSVYRQDVVKTVELAFDVPGATPDGVPVNRYSLTVASDANGVFRPYTPVALPEAGYFDVFVKEAAHLRKRLGSMQIRCGPNTPPPTWESEELLAGDFIENKIINIFDISDFMTIYKQLEVPITLLNRKYDVNEDGVINIYDISVVLANYTALNVPGDEY